MMLAALYVLGWPVVMVAVAFVAYKKRGTHGMTRGAAALLALLAGMVWPLLAVAAVQIALVGFATLPDRLRSRTGADAGLAEEPESAGLEMAVA